jgi:hypothetical protein
LQIVDNADFVAISAESCSNVPIIFAMYVSPHETVKETEQFFMQFELECSTKICHDI